MRKNFRIPAAFLLVAALLLSFAACDDGGGGPKRISVTSVSLDQSEITLDIGETETLVATILPTNATNKAVTWASDDTSVATVANGVVTAVSLGSAKITVTTKDGSKSASCYVTVNDPDAETVATPAANPASGSVTAGTSVTLSCNTPDAQIWYSTDPDDPPHKDGNEYVSGTTVITINDDTTLKAIATKSGFNNSQVLTATYTIRTVQAEGIKVYANGEFGTGFSITPWSTDIVDDSTAGGGHGSNTKALEVPVGNGQWGWGFGIDSATEVDFTEIDAVTFWVKASEAGVAGTFGFMDDAGEGNDTLNVELKNHDGELTYGTSWQQIVIPVPNPAKAGDRKQVLKLWLGNTTTGTLYIDDIYLVTASSKTIQIIINDTAGTASPNATIAAGPLAGNFEIKYTLDDLVGSLFHNITHNTKTPYEWYPITYNVTGNAEVDDQNIETEASGSFTLTITVMGVTSNSKTYSIGLANSPIIDAFDYFGSDDVGVQQWNSRDPLTAYGYTLQAGELWWGGLVANHAGKKAAQNGSGTNPQFIQRSNINNYDYVNNIRPLVATHSKLQLSVFTRADNVDTDGVTGVAGASSTLTFELHTGPHTTATTGFTAYTCTTNIVSTRNTGPSANWENKPVQYDSDWNDYLLDLADFKDGEGNSITNGTGDIMITGWQLNAPGAINYWVADIKLIED